MMATLIVLAIGELTADLGAWGPALAATAVATAAFTLVQYLLAVRYVQERALAMSVGQVTHSLVKAAGVVAGALLIGTAAGSLAGYAVVCAILATVLAGPVVRPSGPLADRGLWRPALRYGGPLIAVSLSFVALASFDRTILAGIEGEAVAGVYAAAYLIAEGVVSLPAQLLRSVVFTSVLEAYEHNERLRARRLIRRSGDAVLLMSAPVVVAFALAGGWIVETVSGGGYRVPNAVPALVAAGLVAYRLGSLDAIGFNLVLASGGLARTFGYATALALSHHDGSGVGVGTRGSRRRNPRRIRRVLRPHATAVARARHNGVSARATTCRRRRDRRCDLGRARTRTRRCPSSGRSTLEPRACGGGAGS